MQACPACSRAEASALLRERGRSVVRCGACGLAFLSPFPSAQELSDLYSGSYYSRDETYEQNLSDEIRGSFGRLLPSGRILDVGSGAGEFLELARSAGYDVHGLDTSPLAMELCGSAGLPFTRAELTEFEARECSFDGITMWDVIEHLTNPRAYLRAARRLLRPGGLLVIKTPDVQWAVMSLARLLSRVNGARGVLGYPAHLLYFDASSLAKLLEVAGFEIVESRHLGSIRTARPRSLRSKAYRLVVGAMERAGTAGNLLFYARRR